jgi:hypothetical protein
MYVLGLQRGPQCLQQPPTRRLQSIWQLQLFRFMGLCGRNTDVWPALHFCSTGHRLADRWQSDMRRSCVARGSTCVSDSPDAVAVQRSQSSQSRGVAVYNRPCMLAAHMLQFSCGCDAMRYHLLCQSCCSGQSRCGFSQVVGKHQQYWQGMVCTLNSVVRRYTTLRQHLLTIGGRSVACGSCSWWSCTPSGRKP